MAQDINDSTVKTDQLTIIQSIVTHLKEYPFLLVSVIAMLVLTMTLAFDLEKIQEFSPLLYGAVFLPLVMQFYIECTKRQQSHQKEMLKEQAKDPINRPSATIENSDLSFSRKAISSFTIIVLTVFSYADMTDNELFDTDMQTGFLIFSIISFSLAVSALNDINKSRTKGKVFTIICISLSVLCGLSSLGYLLSAP